MGRNYNCFQIRSYCKEYNKAQDQNFNWTNILGDASGRMVEFVYTVNKVRISKEGFGVSQRIINGQKSTNGHGTIQESIYRPN